MNDPLVVSSPDELRTYYKNIKYCLIQEGFDRPTVVQRTADFQFIATWNWGDERFLQNPVNWSTYTLYPMPGCCGVAVYSGARIHDPQRGNGLGQNFFTEASDLMKEAGYSCSLCTVISSMKDQIHILEKNGWSKIHSFINRRTKNEVQIWVKNMNQPERNKELPVVPRFI